MSENEKNSKLSEFDFDGDNSVSNEKVVDPSMVQKQSSSQMTTLVLGACLVLALGYYYSSSSAQKSTSTSSQEEMIVEKVVKSSQPIEDTPIVSQPTMIVQEDTMEPAPLSSPSQNDRIMNDNPDSNAQEMIMPIDSVENRDLNKNMATLDDRNWKKLEKEILAQNQSQSEVKNEISSLISKNEELVQSLERNLSQTQSIDRQLSALQENLSSLKKVLGSFDSQFSKIEKKIEAIEKQLVAQAAEFFAETDLATIVQEPVNHYTIYAVIPGRAWLRSHDNSIISVVEGQQVDSLGKVMTIDPRLTSVTFENGTILRQ